MHADTLRLATLTSKSIILKIYILVWALLIGWASSLPYEPVQYVKSDFKVDGVLKESILAPELTFKPLKPLKVEKREVAYEIEPEPPVVSQNGIEQRLWEIGGYPLVELIRHESNFNPWAVNPSSGACGLFQRLPCSVTLGDIKVQIADGTAYILGRYSSYWAAWNFWLTNNWY